MVRTDEERDDFSLTFFQDRASAIAAADEHSGEHNTVVRKTTLEDAFLEITGGVLRCTVSSERCAGSPTATCAS